MSAWLLRGGVIAAVASMALTAQVRQKWGKTVEGREVFLYTLTNARGMEARITNFGAILVSLKVPDKAGRMADVVLGFDTADEYIATPRYFGATVGRYANRIAGATFRLEGAVYTLPKNNRENCLHGGIHGFHKAVWQERSLGKTAVELGYRSADGEEGFPGNLSATVKYMLTDDNALQIDYTAETDKATPVNFTNHSFFNLSGEGSGDVLQDVATLEADRYTPVNGGLIPTGELRPVAGTAFDFRKPVAIGTRIRQDDEQLKIAKGYDHNYVLNHKTGQLGVAGQIADPKSGRVLTVWTTEPGMQFYTANNLDGTGGGKRGHKYDPYSAFCMETQHFPDSPNQPAFPSTILRPGNTFRSTTVFRFSTR